MIVVGMDFRAQLSPIFLKSIGKYLNLSLIKATKQFEVDMEQFTLINKDVLSLKRHDLNTDGQPNVSEVQANSPPESLLGFRPLAIYCNALLNLFNELRVCAPIAIAQPFVIALEVSLENVAKSILNFYRSEQQAFGTKEKENFARMCSVFSFELLPYLQNCIIVIFIPNNKLTNNIEGLTTLRKSKVLEPIEHLLPSSTKI